MRIDINLASQPYEDARQFWMRWGSGLGIVGLLTLILVISTITGWFNARRDHQQMASLRAQIASRDAARSEDEAILNKPENRNTRDQSRFINQLIERKAFSWTRVVENLEKVMPPRVHLVSINPELSDDNELALKMVVAGDSRDRALELPRRMEESQRFAQSRIVSETGHPSPNGDNVQFDIEAIYIPEPVITPVKTVTPAREAAPAAGGAATKPQVGKPLFGKGATGRPAPGAGAQKNPRGQN